MEELKNIRNVFSEQGTRFDCIFDVLKSLDCGIGRVMEGSKVEIGYITEKLHSLKSACEMIQHDTLVFLLRRKSITEKEFDRLYKVIIE